MNNSGSFFVSGWEHIVDIHAYDHLLFIITLCAAFKLNQWKQILVIVTAFTIGHSGTLILSSLDMVPSNSKIVETLIPFTIMLTAITNIVYYKKEGDRSAVKLKYGIALLFGLIHGLAFASGFKFMLFEESVVLPLFLFNLGIEVGQLFIVALFAMLLWVFTKVINVDHYKWNLFVSGAGFGIAVTLLINVLTAG